MNIAEYQNYHETKEHTNPDFPYNTYLCSIPLDFTTVPLHWHEEIELIVIKKGHGLVSVDFHTKTVSPGDMVFILPGQLHSISQKENFHMEYENIIFKQELLFSEDYDLCKEDFLSPTLTGRRPCHTFLSSDYLHFSEISGCIEHIDELCGQRPKGYQLALKGELFLLFFYLITEQKNKDSVLKVKTKSLEKIKTVLKYVEVHYADVITVENMASLTYYSKSHFMKFFKTHMGVGFIEYLNDYRLSMAARLLITGNYSVLDTATQTGFSNLSYFNRLFRRKFGQTPTVYRHEMQN